MVDGMQKERVPELAERTLAVAVHNQIPSTAHKDWFSLGKFDLPALAADSCIEEIQYF